MNPALWAAVIAANISRQSSPSVSNQPWWAEKSTLPRWPRLLLWLIRRRTQRRLAGKTWGKLDDWLWDQYFKAIEGPVNDNQATVTPSARNVSHA